MKIWDVSPYSHWLVGGIHTSLIPWLFDFCKCPEETELPVPCCRSYQNLDPVLHCTKCIHSTGLKQQDSNKDKKQFSASCWDQQQDELRQSLCWGFGRGNGHIPTDPTHQKKTGLRGQPSASSQSGSSRCTTLQSRPSKEQLFMVTHQSVWDPGIPTQLLTAPHLIKSDQVSGGSESWETTNTSLQAVKPHTLFKVEFQD